MRSGNGLALLLIGFGALLIFGKLGIFGWVMGLLIPILVFGLGVIAWRNGNRFLGGVIGAIGGLMLLGQLSHLFVWAVAVVLIAIGVSRIRRNPSVRM